MESLQFWLRETLDNIARNRLMSLLAVSTVTIGLFILGAFYLSISNLQTAVSQTTQKLDIVVFLERDISPKRRLEIYNAARMPQVADLEIVMASAALKDLKKTYTDLPIDDFGKTNPLSDELRIKLKNPDDLFKVRDYLGSLQGVKDVKNQREADEAVKRLLALNRFLTVAGLVALLILGMAILLIIHNAIRLTVFARRREIRIMQLVGATPGFIRVPFLLEGLFYGFVGALISALALGPLYLLASSNPAPLVKSLLPLAPAAVLGPCLGLMLLAGLFFGLVGSWMSLNPSQKHSVLG